MRMHTIFLRLHEFKKYFVPQDGFSSMQTYISGSYKKDMINKSLSSTLSHHIFLSWYISIIFVLVVINVIFIIIVRWVSLFRMKSLPLTVEKIQKQHSVAKYKRNYRLTAFEHPNFEGLQIYLSLSCSLMSKN